MQWPAQGLRLEKREKDTFEKYAHALEFDAKEHTLAVPKNPARHYQPVAESRGYGYVRSARCDLGRPIYDATASRLASSSLCTAQLVQPPRVAINLKDLDGRANYAQMIFVNV